MKYEAWRISFQSSEAAARSAYTELTLCSQQLAIAIKGINETIEDNLHLADGNNCTLIKLKQAIVQIRELDSAKLANKRPSLSR